jgi:gliding motility-associated-like protein
MAHTLQPERVRRPAGRVMHSFLRTALMVFATFLLWQGEARATHAMGGDLTYECLGGNQYKVTLNFFRDCNGVAAPTTCNNGRRFTVRSTQCNANFTACFGLESVEVITPICDAAPDRCTDPNGTYGVERYRFSAVINLSQWANCGTDWIIDWELCCRNNAITSLNNPGSRNIYLRATLNNIVQPCNSSPRFLNDPVPFACVGQQVTYNHGVSDLAGDSLSFELAPARGTAGALIPYNAGYSFLQPVITAGGANAVQINPATGTITFVPSIQQFAVVSVLVKEYRNGALIGSYIRDVQFAIIACSNNNPTVSGINGGNTFTYDVCAGESFCFTVNSADADAAQIVTMNWNGAIPGATFTTTNSSRPVGTFCWSPTVADIGSQLFTVTVTDNACDLNGNATQGYLINITPPFTPANAGPDQSICASTTTLAGQLPYQQVQGTWTVLSGTGTFANANSPTTTVSGLSQGQNIFRWSVDYGTCGIATDEVVITRFNPLQPAANAGPGQMLCTPNNQTTLAANAAIPPAVGTWTVVSGAGVFADPNSPTTQVTGLVIGQNTFRWTINNGPCGAPTQSTITVMLYDYAQPAANAGPDQIFCSIPPVVQLGAQPNNGTWTVVSGTGVFADPTNRNTTVTGLSVGVNTFGWVIFNGPCEPPSTADDVSIIVYDPNSSPANAGPNQQVCTAGTTLAGNTPISPAVGTWTLVSGSGTITSPNSPSSAVTGLGIGNNVFQWTVNNGPCGVTTSQVTITRFNSSAASANAGPDQNLCTAVNSIFASTTLAGNAAAAPAVGTWTVVSGAAVFANANSPTTAVSNLPVGVNVLRWTILNGPCTPPSSFDDVVINVFDRTAPVANAGSDQDLCAPVSFVTLAAIPPVVPAAGQWTVISGSGSFANDASPTTTVTGMANGTNVYRWTVNNGPCPGALSFDDVVIRLFDGGVATANAGPDQVLCGPGTTTLAGSSVIAPGTGLWTVVSGTAIIADPANPAASVSGIPLGVTVLRWTVNNGPCGSSFDEVSITRFSANSEVANAGADVSICIPVAPNQLTLSGSPVIAPAVGTWTLVNGFGIIASPNDPNTLVTSLAVGVNVFQWTVDNGSCVNGITSDLVTVYVHDATIPPAIAGPDQTLCSESGSTTLAGNTPGVPATGTWILVSGTAFIADSNNPNTAVTGLTVGEHVFEWTIDNGPCGSSTDRVTILVFDPNQPFANAGPDQGICTDLTNSITLQGSPVIFPAVGVWTFTGGTATILDVNDPFTSVTGLESGAYIFTWTVSNGPCPDPLSSNTLQVVVANGEAQPAFAGADKMVCDVSSEVVMDANEPEFPANGYWTVIQGSASFSDPNSSTATVTDLAIGINVLQWNIDNLECGITIDQVTILVFDPNNPVADAGEDQFLCTPVTSTNLAGSSLIVPAVGQWTLIGGSGTIANPASPTSTVSNLGLGENIFQWQVINGVCDDPISTDQVSIFVYEEDAPLADAGPDQVICTPQTSVTMAANAPVGAAMGSWTLVSGGGTIVSPGSPNSSITGLPVGVNVFRWNLDNGACGISTDLVSIIVHDANSPVANAGADQQLCTPTSSTTLAGSVPIFPSTGTWVLLNGTAQITNPSDPNTTVTGLAVGENIFQWTVDNGPCASGVTSDLVTIFVFDQGVAAANAGADQQFCTPTEGTTLFGSAAAFPSTVEWQLVSGSGVIASANASTTAVTGLGVGTNIFSYTVSNGVCGSTTDQVAILIFDENNPVADAGADEQLCHPITSTTLNGSALIAPATGTWTVIDGTGVFADAASPGTQVNGLSIGQNTFRWTVSNGPCTSAITFDEVSIFVFDPDAPAANAGNDQQLCTPVAIASLQGNTPTFPAQGEWTLVSGSGTITDPASPTTTVTALGVGVNVFAWTITNGPCAEAITTDEVTIILNDANNPSPNAGPDQELCTPQLSTVLAGSTPIFPATGVWEVLSGSGDFVDPTDPTTTVNDLAIGDNVFLWTVTNGTCETGSGFDFVTVSVFDENNPVADAGADQELCTDGLATTTLSGSALTYPANGTWTLVSGSGLIVSPQSPTTSVIDLAVGVNIFQWTVSNGPCPEGVTTDQVSIVVFDQSMAQADAGADQDLCSPVGSIQLNGSAVTSPAVGTWTILSGSGTLTDANDPQTTITGAVPGIIQVQWEVSNGPCPSGNTSDVMVVQLFNVDELPANAGPDQQLCMPENNTFLQGSAVNAPAVGTWTLVSGQGTIVSPNLPNTAVQNCGVGENVFQWTVDNGPCGEPTVDLVRIFVFDVNNPDADAGPDQQVCTPVTSALMAGSPVTFPAVGTWNLISGQGTLADANDPNTTVTGLGIGDNIFEWVVDNGSCANGITFDQVTIVLFDADAPPADAGPDQQLCAPDDAVVMAANAPVGSAVGTWTLVQGAGAIADANDPSTAITGLVVGINTFLWTLESGDCVTTSDAVNILVFDPENASANAGPDQELCVPDDSAFMAGSPLIVPATGAWTLISGTGVPVDAGDPLTQITGLTEGVNVFQWEVSNGPCANGLTLDLVSITVYGDTTASANAGPDLESCLPLDFIQLQGEVPPAPAQGIWTVIAGTGQFANPNSATTMVTGLSQGVNTFVWTLSWDPCPNNGVLSDTVNVLVYDPEAAIADAGPDQELCGPGVTANMAANIPEIPGVGTWSVLSGTAQVADVNNPFATVTNLGVGVHTLLWTIYNGVCGFGPPSSDTLRIAVYDGEAAPAQTGADVSVCEPVNSAVLQANTPVFPATGIWTVTTGQGVFSDASDPFSAVFGLGVGQHDFVWSIDNGPCGHTDDQMSVFIFGADEAANAGPDQQVCTPNTTVTMAGNAVVFPAEGTWTLVSGTGTINDPSMYNTTVSGLSVGANVFQWTVLSGPCGETSDQVVILVFDENQPPANAGADQELCSPATSTTLQGSQVIYPAIGSWMFISGSGTLSDPTSPTATVSGLSVGTTVLVWMINNGPCASGITTDEVTITVYDGTTQAAAAGPDQSYCTPLVEPITMFASSPTAPATGEWTVVSGSAGIASPNDPFSAVTNVGLGSHVFRWTVDNGACGSTSDEITISVYDHTAPLAQAGESLLQCEQETSAQLSAMPALSTSTGFWSILQGNGTIANPGDPNSMVDQLPPGFNWFVWTVDNGACGVSSDTLLIRLKDCLTLTIPDAFSPNGDGINDFYVIENLLSYPGNKFQVFNRWGNKVLDRSPYVNDWDGTSQFGAMFGEKLPESTYYYVLDLGDGKETYTGFIFLRR